jgi:hypothetical protein
MSGLPAKGERHAYHPFSRDLAFDPEHIQAMLTAFDIVCLKLSGEKG